MALKNRLNGNLYKWVTFSVGIILIVIAWVWYASTMCYRVEANEKEDIAAHAQFRDATQKNHDDILTMKSDIQHIKESVDKNALIQQQILKELRNQ
jgi:hypothetical protein